MKRTVPLLTLIKRVARQWLPLAVAICALCAILYTTVQQVWRAGVDDPQIQLAEDAAAALGDGAAPDEVVPATQVDVARSLAPFMISLKTPLRSG